MTSPLSRARRAWEFGRRIPPGKLARRASLMIRRRLGRYIRPTVAQVSAVPVGDPPEVSLFPAAHGRIRVEGDDLLFTFLGRSVRMSAAALDWSAPGPSAQDQLWRMNLHYMEYLEEVDDELFQVLVRSWIEGKGEPRREAWRDSWNTYALSIRACVWMQELARRRKLLPAQFVQQAEDSMFRQLRFLERNIETDIGGNHLIKNIKALLWAGHYFEGGAADRWRRKGLVLLSSALSTQLLPDGLHFERSFSYHCQVFADLLECRAILAGSYESLDGALSRMAQPLADLVHPDGYVIQFNDAGLTMARSPAECLAAYRQLSGAGPDPRNFFAYRDGGYFGCRFHDYYLVADCGPICPDDLPAHGHGDVLSIEMSVAGHRLIVDQGVFEYAEGPRRQAARSAAMHNTLSIPGVDQADFFGAFRCGRRPRAKLVAWSAEDGAMNFEGSHDGYAREPGRPVHRRRITATSSCVTILDVLESKVDYPLRIGFLLHPDVELAPGAGAGALILRSPEAKEVRMSSNAPLAVEPAVWWPDMGVERATVRIVAAGPVGQECIETRIAIGAAQPTERMLSVQA